jgi:cytochrome c-type biogenesis protein CcmH/NrfG
MPLDEHIGAPALFKKQMGLAWARGLYLAGLASSLVFVLPVSWFPISVGKSALFAFFLLLSVIVFTLAGGWKGFWRASGVRAAVVVALLPVVYLVSGYISNTLPWSFVGSGSEVDTIVFTSLAAFAFLFAFALFRTARSAWLFTTVVFYSLLAAVVFQFVQIMLGGAVLPFEALSDRTVNLIGKWNDLALTTALLLLMTLVRLEFSSLPGIRLLGIGVVGLAAFVLLGFTNFSFVWGMLIVTLVVAILFKILHSPIAPDEHRQLNWRHHMPWITFGAAGLLAACLFFGAGFNGWLTQFFPVNALEVRPSFSSTMEVVDAARGDSVKNLFLGTGPATFGSSWLMHKPGSVNQSIFWNLDFVVGFSVVVSALGTVGIVGALAWLIAPLLCMFAFLRALRTQLFRSRERTLALTLALGSIFLALSYIFYIPSQNVVLLTFAFMGATFGFLWRSAQRERDIEEVDSARVATIGRNLFAVLIIIAVFAGSVLVIRRALSETFVFQGQESLSQGQSDAALMRAGQAAWFESTSNTALLTLAAGFVKMQQIANDSSLPAQTAQDRFSSALTATVDAGRRAIALAPEDYRPYLLLGNVYAFLSALNTQGAYESARSAYESAATYNPKSPEIPLALARLEAEADNLSRAEAEVTKALTLKSDYTDAILFVVQLAVAQNDMQNAIRAATAAVQSAPGVASIWFQLGLLYYTTNDMRNATPALEKAIELTPEYANAKYFLGLAYYAQSRPQEAIRLFEQLQQENPGNNEVSLILSNMRFGKQPFDGAAPPTTNPEDRTTAPISQ